MSETTPSGPSSGQQQQMEERDLYQVLRVDPLASREIIAEAYWALVRKAQALRTEDETTATALHQLNFAYATLVNPQLRDSYNRTLPPHRLDGARGGLDISERPARHRLLGPRQLPSSPNKRNLYQILQVDPHAEQEIIAAAYACLRQQGGEGIWSGQASLEALDEVTEAFSVLADREQRAAYDATLPGLRQQEEAIPDPSPPPVAAKPSTAPPDSARTAKAVTRARTMALASAADWPGLSHKPGRLLGRLVLTTARAAWRASRYAGRHLYRGTRWLVIVIVAPAGRKLGRLLGRLLRTTARAAWQASRYTGRHLHRGTRWLVIVVVAPSALKLVTAGSNHIDALLKWLELRPPPPLTGNVDYAIRQRFSENNALLLQGPLPATAPRNSEQPATALARLVICDGPHAGSTFILTDRPVSLGAGPQCDVILEAQGDDVAPLHARIWYREGRFMIHQVADRGKILIGGQPLAWGVLEDGDELAIGQHRLVFELTPPEGATLRAQAEQTTGDEKR